MVNHPETPKDAAEAPLLSPAQQQLLERFVSEQDIRPGSRESYFRALRQFFLWVVEQGFSFQKIDKACLLRYKDHLLLERGLSELTVASYLTVTRRFFAWAEENALLENVAQGVRGPRRKDVFKKDALAADEVQQLLENVPKDDLIGLRNYAILNLMVRTGLRTVEVVRANVQDLALRHRQRVLWVQGKGRDAKDAYVLITDKSYGPIRDYLAERGQVGLGAPLFASHSNRNPGERLTTRLLRGMAKQHLRGIGLDERNFTAHSLRHTAGTSALRAGADLFATQLFLRHASPHTTERYLKSVTEEIRLRDAPEHLLDDVF